MSDRPVSFTTGLPETVLDSEPVDALARLADALSLADQVQRRDAVAAVVADYPKFLDGWAQLGRLGRDATERYAAHRVGYHRGLDRLRASGWRGSGFVRWRNPTNRGFLRALDGLRAAADEIGEVEERDRCDTFLHQLDPDWDRRPDAD